MYLRHATHKRPDPFVFWCKARNPCSSSFCSFFRARKKTHGTNNGRFHWKPQHTRTDEGMDFQRNRTGRRSLALAAAPFSYNLFSLFLYFFCIFILRQKIEEGRFRDGNGWCQTHRWWQWRRLRRARVIMPFAGLKILLACRHALARETHAETKIALLSTRKSIFEYSY